MTPFPELFAQFRDENNKNVTELAHLLSCSISYISCIEHGKRKPSHDLVQKFSQELHLSPEQEAELWAAYQQFLPQTPPAKTAASLTSTKPRTNLERIPCPYHRTHDFIGREKQLQQLQTWLPQSQIILVRASAGMGKTTLVYRLAQSYLAMKKPTFGALIWVTFQPDNLTVEGIKQKRSPMDHFNEWLYLCREVADCLNRPDILDKANLETELPQILSQHNGLLIIDNFETVEENPHLKNFIEAFATAPQAKLLLTSRHAFNAEMILNLEVLPKREALQLISRISENKGKLLNQAQKQSLLAATEGRAIAIVWSLGRMAMGDNIDLVLGELNNPHGDLVKFCFERSYTHIKGETAEQILAALCLFAYNSATPTTLAAVTNISRSEVEKGLAILDRLSFINNGAQISLQPLTKEFASVVALPQFKHDLAQDFVRYFAGICHEQVKGDYWGGLIYPTKLIEKELANIKSAFEMAYDLKMWAEVEQLFFGLVHLLSSGNSYRRLRIEYTYKALEAAEHFDNLKLQALYYIDAIAWSFLANHDPKKSVDFINKGLNMAILGNFVELIAHAKMLLAEKHLYFDEFDETVFWDYMTEITAIAEKSPVSISNTRLKARIYEMEMFFYRRKKEWAKAEAACHQAYEIHKQWRTIEAGWFERFLGELYLLSDKPDKLELAKKAFQTSIQVRSKFSEHRLLPMAYMGLAIVSLHERNEKEAIHYATQARKIAQHFDLPDELAAINGFIAAPTITFDLAQFDLF